MLEDLAKAFINSDLNKESLKIYDQYCNFISMENYMFQLAQENSYISFHDPKISQFQAEANIKKTVDDLFSVIITMSVIPIIRCPKGDAAEHVATQLYEKIRNFLETNQFKSNLNRPVLLIVDRNIDLSVMISHSWNYQTLIHDLLSYKLNRVTFESEDNAIKSLKIFDLETNEPFWSEHCGLPFSTVAKAIEYKINEIDKKKKAYNNKDGDENDEQEILKKTSNFVNSLPKLDQETKVLSKHTDIATGLLKIIKERNIDEYFTLEEEIMSDFQNRDQSILSLLEGDKGTSEDKLRLFLIYYMSKNNEMKEEFENILKKININLDSLKYLKKYFYLF